MHWTSSSQVCACTWLNWVGWRCGKASLNASKIVNVPWRMSISVDVITMSRCQSRPEWSRREPIQEIPNNAIGSCYFLQQKWHEWRRLRREKSQILLPRPTTSLQLLQPCLQNIQVRNIRRRGNLQMRSMESQEPVSDDSPDHTNQRSVIGGDGTVHHHECPNLGIKSC